MSDEHPGDTTNADSPAHRTSRAQRQLVCMACEDPIPRGAHFVELVPMPVGRNAAGARNIRLRVVVACSPQHLTYLTGLPDEQTTVDRSTTVD